MDISFGGPLSNPLQAVKSEHWKQTLRKWEGHLWMAERGVQAVIRLLGTERMAYYEQKWRCGKKGDKGEFCLENWALQQESGHVGLAFSREGFGARSSVFVSIKGKGHSSRKGQAPWEGRETEKGQKPSGCSYSGRRERNQGSKGTVRGREIRPREKRDALPPTGQATYLSAAYFQGVIRGTRHNCWSNNKTMNNDVRLNMRDFRDARKS